MIDAKKKIDELDEKLAQANEDLFLAKSDLEFSKSENIALKNFVQNLYESCEGLEDMEIDLAHVIKNLKENIRVFAKDHGITL